MCTAATYRTKDFYMGRTLDYEFSYGEEVVVMPRGYDLQFRHMGKIGKHFAMIGMAHVADGYPLFYEAFNEKGIGMAGLNFVGNAVYAKVQEDAENVAQYEFIPWILGQCASLAEVRALLERLNLVDTPFSREYPCAQLHWLIADKSGALTVESMADGLHVYDNPVGVLTNNPPFPMQLFRLNDYMGLSAQQPNKRFSSALELRTYSRGMGAIGLPGDLSSASRFARAAFVRMNSVSGDSEEESVSQFFHILGAVEQQRGCCEVEDGRFEYTIYTSCCNTDKGIYYYTTYQNHQITAVDMYREKLDGCELKCYPLMQTEQIRFMQTE